MSEELTGTRPLDASQRGRVALPFMVCTLVWSSTWLVIRYQLGIVPPSWSVAYRFLIACIAMMAYARFTGARLLKLTAREHGLAAVYGVAQYCLNYYFVYLGERTVTSGLVAVAFALLVVPNALFAWIFLKQGLSRAFLLGSGVAMIGLVLLFSHELAAAPTSRHTILIGIGWSLAGVLFSSIANVMQASKPAGAIPVPTLIAWGMAWGSLFNCAGAFALDGPPVFDPHPGYWLGTLYLALIGSALAFSCYFAVIRAIGPGRAAYSSVLSPVLAMLLSTMFEGYRWSLSAAAGCLLAIAGLVVALQARQAAKPTR